MTMTTWEIRDCYDVWGNQKDGWRVNDSLIVGTYNFPERIIENDKALLVRLKEMNLLTTSDLRKIAVDGDYGVIEIKERKTEKPLFWMFKRNV